MPNHIFQRKTRPYILALPACNFYIDEILTHTYAIFYNFINYLTKNQADLLKKLKKT